MTNNDQLTIIFNFITHFLFKTQKVDITQSLVVQLILAVHEEEFPPSIRLINMTSKLYACIIYLYVHYNNIDSNI